jgi:RimJ/RimL family protein N-acetyltransferase
MDCPRTSTEFPPEGTTLRTPRLLLRPWRDSDRAPWAALNSDPEVMRHFPAPMSREQSDRCIDAWQAELAERGWGQWALERSDAGAAGEFVGFVGLTVPKRALPFMPCVEIGWRLARAHWGQGLASEGARAALDFGFGSLGLDEIVSFTALSNLRSQAVMRRIGMHNAEADFDHPALPEGHPLRRHCLWRLRRSEWEQRR